MGVRDERWCVQQRRGWRFDMVRPSMFEGWRSLGAWFRWAWAAFDGRLHQRLVFFGDSPGSCWMVGARREPVVCGACVRLERPVVQGLLPVLCSLIPVPGGNPLCE